MDARRLGARRDLIIRGTRKIYDPIAAHIGMLLASRTSDSVFRCYHDTLCERFWCGELDIEDTRAIRTLLVEAGAEGRAFDELIASGEGAGRCRAIAAEAEERGVFGVPTFLLHETGELFWGMTGSGFCVSGCRPSCKRRQRSGGRHDIVSRGRHQRVLQLCSRWLLLDFL